LRWRRLELALDDGEREMSNGRKKRRRKGGELCPGLNLKRS